MYSPVVLQMLVAKWGGFNFSFAELFWRVWEEWAINYPKIQNMFYV